MKSITTILLITTTVLGWAQPKNLKQLMRDCENYIVNIENIDFKTTVPSQFYIEEVIVEEWDSLVNYQDVCRKPIPVTFEGDIGVSLKTAIDRIYGELKGHIPVTMVIKEFDQRSFESYQDMFEMKTNFYIRNDKGELKLIFVYRNSVPARNGYFEKKLSKLLKSTLFELHYKNAFYRDLPYYENDSIKRSHRDGIIFEWEDVLNRDPTMLYPCKIKLNQEKGEYPWYSLEDCTYHNIYDPNNVKGLINNDSIFIKMFKNHFVYLKPIGNDFFLARDHIYDQNQVMANSIMFGLAGGLLTRALTDKKVFYIFSPEGDVSTLSLLSLRRELKDEKDLLRKYKTMLSAKALTPDIQEQFIIELLRRQEKIPRN